MEQQRWQQTEVLAWTANDSPGSPPSSPSRWITGSVAATLTVTLAGIIATDALCPDHRAWVQTLASVAIFGAVIAIVQVMRDQASAALFAMGSSLIGVAIGVIDASHDPGRGALIAVGFALAGFGSSVVAFRLDQLARWGRRTAAAHQAPDLVTVPVTTVAAATVAATNGPASEGTTPSATAEVAPQTEPSVRIDRQAP